VVKAFGLVSILVALAVIALVWSQQARRTRAEAPTAVLQAATTALELNHRIRGTYAGVSFSDVKVVRADARSYCVEAAGSFVSGPGGRPQRGHC
jgi:type II secretory pathway pseudopilin PulG